MRWPAGRLVAFRLPQVPCPDQRLWDGCREVLPFYTHPVKEGLGQVKEF